MLESSATAKLAETDMSTLFRSCSARYAALCASFVLLSVFAVFGQSGRRTRKPAPPVVPAAEPTPSPTPAEKTKPVLTFVVGMDRFSDFSRIPVGTAETVLRTCAHRLDEPQSVSVVTASQDMARGQAIIRAKAEKEAFVVWLQLRSDRLGGGPEPSDTRFNVYIEYTVFAPVTAKQLTFGVVTPKTSRNRGVIVDPRSPDAAGYYYLTQSAKETAERILAAFGVRTPGKFP